MDPNNNKAPGTAADLCDLLERKHFLADVFTPALVADNYATTKALLVNVTQLDLKTQELEKKYKQLQQQQQQQQQGQPRSNGSSGVGGMYGQRGGRGRGASSFGHNNYASKGRGGSAPPVKTRGGVVSASFHSRPESWSLANHGQSGGVDGFHGNNTTNGAASQSQPASSSQTGDSSSGGSGLTLDSLGLPSSIEEAYGSSTFADFSIVPLSMEQRDIMPGPTDQTGNNNNNTNSVTSAHSNSTSSMQLDDELH